ncbi:MAG TPA: cysteine desulfurase family protein [Rhizomicrobium sp.]|jgi:cysteine desulfurase|nr:cysteine desulfurase family protein [Rhizomicrobium sp.]
MHYCDHNATAPLRLEARKAVERALSLTGNPSSVHAGGRAARAMVEEARDAVARLAGAKSESVIFTSGATEANALALWGAVEAAMDAGKPVTRLLVSAIEHKSVLKTAEVIAERVPGIRIEIVPVTANGVVDIEALTASLQGEGHALVAVMAANNETGVMQPVAEISRLCRAAGALLLVDAVTAAGKIPLDAGLCDYMSLSGHKLGAPQGVGALIVSDAAPLAPQLVGGGQQKGLRAGTENLSGIAGFGAATKALLLNDEERTRLAALRDGFEHALKEAVPDAVILGANAPRLANTSNVALPGLAAENMVIALDLDGVMVSSGSSCSSGKIAASHVLAAMGKSDLSSIRVSFGWNSNQDDADAVVTSLIKLWQRARPRVAA